MDMKWMPAIVLTIGLTVGLTARAEIKVYPDAGGANLRVPMIPTVEGGAKGKHVAFEGVTFRYPLRHFSGTTQAFEADFHLRDLPRRAGKTALALTGEFGWRLQIEILPAAQGRGVTLTGPDGLATGTLPLGREWQHFQLSVKDGKATLTSGGRSIATSVTGPIQLESLAVYAAVIDELELSGPGGRFVLDWEEDYAARIMPQSDSSAPLPPNVSVDFFGFDNFAVSFDPERRDCPTVYLANSGTQSSTVKINYEIKSEIHRREAGWTEEIEIPGLTGLTRPIALPFEPAADIYHLTATVIQGESQREHCFHFMYAPPRHEPAGPGVFGLHDSDVNVFGFWPDALPLRFAHKYLRWGYVVGPAWIKDWNGDHGIDPDTPAEQWNWNEKLDWELAAGRELYVCLYGTPLLDWQRARPYEKMRKLTWGWAGGFPELNRYRAFIQAAGERYRGRITRWEIENEPNASGHMPHAPEDYAELSLAVAEELRQADQANVIYGISGTSTFVPWMQKVFAAGAAPAFDVVSWHTYTTPEQPDRVGLAGMLEEAKRVANQHGLKRFMNSETGVLGVLRYQVDEPIAPAVVAEKVAERAPGFVSPSAWPGRVNDEYQASASMVKNAVINLTAGAEGFIFFGWNPQWPREPAKWQEQRPNFGLISATASGERTPSRTTLAVGVLTVQLEGALLDPAPRETGAPSVFGGIFAKAGGGEVAVLWSAASDGSVLLSAPVDELEVVSLWGETEILLPLDRDADTARFLLRLTDRPVYVHAATPGIAVLPSPVDAVRITRENGGTEVRFTLLNRDAQPWPARIATPVVPGVTIEPSNAETVIDGRKRRNLSFRITALDSTLREIELPFAVDLPGGGHYVYPVKLDNKTAVHIPRLGVENGGAAADFSAFNAVPAIALDRVEQAVMGRPPKLASLQEETYWGGPDELSGSVALAYDEEALYIMFTGRDANLITPRPWPGVTGSCVEFFLDLRPEGSGLGEPNYAAGVYQILARPAVGDTPAELFSPQWKEGVPPEVAFRSETVEGDRYRMLLRLPWQVMTPSGKKPEPGVFGFDCGLNGAYPGRNERKTQLMLYGTPLNFRNAADFGAIYLQER